MPTSIANVSKPVLSESGSAGRTGRKRADVTNVVWAALNANCKSAGPARKQIASKCRLRVA